jgi:enoyl-CoA hydratase/carnithine racemase
MQDKFDVVQTEIIDGVGWITLNRPGLRNAISQEMWNAIPEKLSTLHDNGAKAVVFTGAGNNFASGADLEELEQIDNYARAQTFWHALSEALDYVYAFELPLIAMIDGACIGGGLLLSIACDLRYASDTASFGVPVSRLGIVLDDENIARLTYLIGPAYAKEMLFTGDVITAQEAHAIGLVNKIEDVTGLRATVERTAKRIVENGYASIIESKRSVRRATSENARGGLLPQHETVVVSSYLTSDFRTRIKRFFGD